MSKASIVILILCTAVIAGVVFFSLKKDPGIEETYLINSKDIEEAELNNAGLVEFYSTGSKIYLIVALKDVDVGDTLEVEWAFAEGGSRRTIQEDNIELDSGGSGNTAIYLVRRDNAYAPGSYRVKVVYDKTQEKELSFTVIAGSGS